MLTSHQNIIPSDDQISWRKCIERLSKALNGSRSSITIKDNVMFWEIKDFLFLFEFWKIMSNIDKSSIFPEIKSQLLTLKNQYGERETFFLIFVFGGYKDAKDIYVSLYLRFVKTEGQPIKERKIITTFAVFDKKTDQHKIVKIKCSNKRSRDQGKRQLIGHREIESNPGYTSGNLLLGIHVEIKD